MGTNSQTDTAALQAGTAEPLTDVTLSVCIVTYQALEYVRDCLQSLYANTNIPSIEITIVDNGSTDGLQQFLKEAYPQVRLIQNDSNEDFTRPTNQALRASSGRYLLLLNPDTVVLPQALDKLAEFLDTHPQVGICGPKVLNRDLTLQKPCRRGDARPWAVLTYFSGIWKLFPKSKLFGQYLLTYMDEDETHPVDGVSGSCMLIRREVIDQIGYLDERFFAYQEDADFCYRARQAGWQVFYVPTAQIIHYGGMGGSRVEPFRSIFEWHKSYFLFYRKNFAKDYFFLFNWVYYVLMLLKFLSAVMLNLLRKEKFAGAKRP